MFVCESNCPSSFLISVRYVLFFYKSYCIWLSSLHVCRSIDAFSVYSLLRISRYSSLSSYCLYRAGESFICCWIFSRLASDAAKTYLMLSTLRSANFFSFVKSVNIFCFWWSSYWQALTFCSCSTCVAFASKRAVFVCLIAYYFSLKQFSFRRTVYSALRNSCSLFCLIS